MKKLMSTRGQLLGSLGLVAITALAVTGCAGKFTGGGKLPSADLMPGHSASFGFTYAITETDGSGRLSGSYHDSYVFPGVKFSFKDLQFGVGPCSEVADAATCAMFDMALGVSSDECLVGQGSYVSTNPTFFPKVGGDLFIAGCDRGEPGPSSGDSLFVDPITGPYASYVNSGFTTNGNLQAH
jgi:hypothetical protein